MQTARDHDQFFLFNPTAALKPFYLVNIQVNSGLLCKLEQVFGLLRSLGDVWIAEVASADETETRAHQEQQMQRLRPFVSEFMLDRVEASQEIDGGKSNKIDQQTSDRVL